MVGIFPNLDGPIGGQLGPSQIKTNIPPQGIFGRTRMFGKRLCDKITESMRQHDRQGGSYGVSEFCSEKKQKKNKLTENPQDGRTGMETGSKKTTA